jgi:hypothetical protein
MAGYLALKSLLLRDRKEDSPGALDRLCAETIELHFNDMGAALGEPFHSL